MKFDSFLEKLIRGFFRIFKKELKDEMVTSLIQFVKFGLVGVTNTLISYLLNILVVTVLRPLTWKWDYMAANIVAFILSVLWSFYWNNKYVFTKKEGEYRSVWKTLIKTYLSYAFTGIILSNVLSYVWVDLLRISKYVAPLINLIISVPLNFIINKLWAFRTTRKPEKDSEN